MTGGWASGGCPPGRWLMAMGLIGCVLAAPARAGTPEGAAKWQAGDYAGAIAEWREPAAGGDATAQFDLAQAYRLGRGVPVDLKMACDLYRKAAVQGHKPAQANLGLTLFQLGEQKEALPWLDKAASRGEPRAQYAMSVIHYKGELVPRDRARAYALMSSAAAAGLVQAQTALAEMDRIIPLAERRKAAQVASAIAPSPPAANAPPAPAAPRAMAAPLAPVPPAAPLSERQGGTPAAAGPWAVQLGAFSTQAAAQLAWTQARRIAALADLEPRFVPAARLVRLQAVGFPSQAAASRACAAATAAGQPCFPLGKP